MLSSWQMGFNSVLKAVNLVLTFDGEYGQRACIVVLRCELKKVMILGSVAEAKFEFMKTLGNHSIPF
jgi:hypothetical protein